MYFDSHSHYYDSKLIEEAKNGSVDSLIDALLLDGNVSYIVNVGTNSENSRIAIEQCRRHKNMYAVIGIHPGDCKEESDMETALNTVESLIKENSDIVVAIGEIGFDYHWEPIEKEKQIQRQQEAIAKKCLEDAAKAPPV